MMIFMVITAVLSAFLDNVTTVLLVGPMTITIARMLKSKSCSVSDDADSCLEYRRYGDFNR